MRALVICFWAILLATGLFLTACATHTESQDDYTLYLVRHAEKVADGSDDPGLTAVGRVRAVKIAAQLQNKRITEIWSSDYMRTRDTAMPLAKELGIKLEIYDPDVQGKLVTQLQQRHHNALIVGHSDTIPELAGMLCNCEVEEMEETEYDRLIIIRMLNGVAQLQTQSQ